jgi:hypothetical protein
MVVPVFLKGMWRWDWVPSRFAGLFVVAALCRFPMVNPKSPSESC